MKKKIFIILLVGLFVFNLCGCTKTEGNNTNETEEVKLADNEFEVRGKKYKLDQDETGYGINFKVASNFVFRDTGNSLSYYAEKNEDGTSDFVVRILYYKNKSLDYAIKDTVTEYDSKTEVEINGIKYTKVHFTNYNDANTYLFYYVKGKEVYVFCFTAWEELERFENIFLNNVVFEPVNESK